MTTTEMKSTTVGLTSIIRHQSQTFSRFHHIPITLESLRSQSILENAPNSTATLKTT